MRVQVHRSEMGIASEAGVMARRDTQSDRSAVEVTLLLGVCTSKLSALFCKGGNISWDAIFTSARGHLGVR
jgi:hypothetical protein